MLVAIVIASGFFSCGTERQEMKVLRDRGAARLSAPVHVTVEQLIRARRPRSLRGRSRVEHLVAVIDVTVVDVRDEADGDLHVALEGATGATLIAELPSPACTMGSRYTAQMRRAREDFLRLISLFGRRRGPVRLRISGVVFFDRQHGQTRAAFNGIELHPVLSVEALRR
jgi:hypothetical protein